MDYNDVRDTLNESKDLLEKGGNQDELLSNLKNLGAVVQSSSQDENFRLGLADHYELLDIAIDCMSNSFLVDFTNAEEEEIYIRILRGIVLLVRNLVAFSSSRIDIPLLLLNIQHFQSKVTSSNPFFIKTLAAYLEVLANMALKEKEDFKANIQLVSNTFDAKFLDIIGSDSSCSLVAPFLALINGCAQESGNIVHLLKDEDQKPLLHYLYGKTDLLLDDEEISAEGDVCISIFEKIISHESYNNWLSAYEESSNSAQFLEILKVDQLVVTNKTDWDNYECTAILAWVFDCYKKWASIADELLYSQDLNDTQLKDMHPKIVIALDMMSDLCKFNAGKQFLEHYALESLIKLLRAAQENTEVLTMRSKQNKVEELKKGSTSTPPKKVFPAVKSLIIEIIAYLCHGSFKTQERIRELHGLELILSNCIIDENNPYIKERSILCLRFVLEKNQANQDFVAQLEAKKVYDDQALQDVGYQVEITDGEVKLKKS